MLPQDPFILFSTLNTWLRDEYASLEELCKDRGLDEKMLREKLLTAGFTYDPETNRFC